MKNLSSHAHKTGSWCLLKVPRPFYIGVPIGPPVFSSGYSLKHSFLFLILCSFWFCFQALAEEIYGYVGKPVHLPCSILKASGIALNPAVESMWAHYDSTSVYRLVIVRNQTGTHETFRQPILGGGTISPNASYKNPQFYGRVNLSASRGLIINNVQSSDAGKFRCLYKDTETKDSGYWEVELIVFNGKYSQVN